MARSVFLVGLLTGALASVKHTFPSASFLQVTSAAPKQLEALSTIRSSIQKVASFDASTDAQDPHPSFCTGVDMSASVEDMTVVQRQVQHYASNVQTYGNKADFATMIAVMHFYRQSGRCGGQGRTVNIILGGAHHGQSTMNILQQCPRAHMHIFEVQLSLIPGLKERFRNFSVTVHHIGFNDVSGNLSVSLPSPDSEIAGVYEPTGRWSGAKQSGYTVPVLPLSLIAANEKLVGAVDFVLIDVEGHEPNAIKGMHLDLEENRRTFPVFQFELGGTWADSRHDENQWDQYATALYLRSLGYELFLLGTQQEQPVLWHVSPELFRLSKALNEGYGHFVQGNLLVVHCKYADAAFLSAISKFVFQLP